MKKALKIGTGGDVNVNLPEDKTWARQYEKDLNKSWQATSSVLDSTEIVRSYLNKLDDDETVAGALGRAARPSSGRPGQRVN